MLLSLILQKSDLLSHKRKLLYEGRIKWMSAHGKAFGLCNAVYSWLLTFISSVDHGNTKITTLFTLNSQFLLSQTTRGYNKGLRYVWNTCFVNVNFNHMLRNSTWNASYDCQTQTHPSMWCTLFSQSAEGASRLRKLQSIYNFIHHNTMIAIKQQTKKQNKYKNDNNCSSFSKCSKCFVYVFVCASWVVAVAHQKTQCLEAVTASVGLRLG